jgi:hypothetical protein
MMGAGSAVTLDADALPAPVARNRKGERRTWFVESRIPMA